MLDKKIVWIKSNGAIGVAETDPRRLQQGYVLSEVLTRCRDKELAEEIVRRWNLCIKSEPSATSAR